MRCKKCNSAMTYYSGQGKDRYYFCHACDKVVFIKD